jgi:hypothetical protein
MLKGNHVVADIEGLTKQKLTESRIPRALTGVCYRQRQSTLDRLPLSYTCM